MAKWWIVGAALVAASVGARAESAAALSLLVSPIGQAEGPSAPWKLALLPRQSKPVTQFSVVSLDAERVLRIASSKSYGKLVHAVDAGTLAPKRLQWDWRIDHSPEADLRSRSGDDVALRVCAFYDWPVSKMPAVDRMRLALAEAVAGEPLPGAAVCYVWDKALPVGTVMPNAFTRRIRNMVVEGDAASLASWREHSRDLQKDFRVAFADEWEDGDTPPPLLAVAIGADTDNTGGEALAYVRSISLKR
jgi:Protein of unknown function (DUF3047)